MRRHPLETFCALALSLVLCVGCTPSSEPPATLDAQLRAQVRLLTETWPDRNSNHPETLAEVATHIASAFEQAGLEVDQQGFTVGGREYRNVRGFLGPREGPRVVVGAHYDVAGSGPGADDNASGVAALIALARILAPLDAEGPVELVAYALEEPPHFGTPHMGSAHHARQLAAEGVAIRVMISLEMLGFYSEEEGSQQYPLPLMETRYPSTGNFVAVVGRLADCELVKIVERSFDATDGLPVEVLCVPAGLGSISLSDHRNYWEQGYHAVMVTDTAFFRNPHYHRESDTYDTLDYNKMAGVVTAVAKAVLDLFE